MTVTIIITIVTCLVSYQCFNNSTLKGQLVHHPYSVNHNNEYYRWITSGFVHKDFLHLGLNMFVFFQFGAALEMELSKANYFGPVLGPVVYLLFYLVAIMASDLPFFAKHKDNAYRSSAGASGAVSAVLFAIMMIHPWHQILLFFAIEIYFILAGILYLLYETYALNQNRKGDNVNHLAHIFGAVFGILGLFAIKPTMIPVYLEKLLDFPWLN